MVTHVNTTGIASASPSALPANNSGDLCLAWVTGKPESTADVTLTDFLFLLKATGGTGSQAADTGQTYAQLLARLTDGSTPTPTLGGGAGGNTATMGYILLRPDAGYVWRDVLVAAPGWVASGADTNTASPWTIAASFAAGSEPVGEHGDAIVSIYSSPTDGGTGVTSATHTATGISGGTEATRSYQETNAGNDCAHSVCTYMAFTGTPSGNITATHTINGSPNSSGIGLLVAVRQIQRAGWGMELR